MKSLHTVCTIMAHRDRGHKRPREVATVEVEDGGVPVNLIKMRDAVLNTCVVPPSNCYSELRLHFEVGLQIPLNRVLSTMGREEGKSGVGWKVGVHNMPCVAPCLAT